jgi:hypothetical protein
MTNSDGKIHLTRADIDAIGYQRIVEALMGLAFEQHPEITGMTIHEALVELGWGDYQNIDAPDDLLDEAIRRAASKSILDIMVETGRVRRDGKGGLYPVS